MNNEVSTINESKDLQITDAHLARREAIKEVEKSLIADSKNCQGIITSHHFGGGCCSREMFVPAGVTFVGKIHRHEYINILIKGKALLNTEDGQCVIEAPVTWVGRSGTKTSAYAITDLVWTNVFRADTTSVKELEAQEIVETFEQLEHEWETGVTPRPKQQSEFIPFKDEDGSWVLHDNLKVTVEGVDSNNMHNTVQSLLEK